MSRSQFYRDPVHGQIRYDGSDWSQPLPSVDLPDERLGWLMQQLIDCREFQRLRHIRQTGLANDVFHGAEHSRFAHSMGVAHLAREMYDRIVKNTGEKIDADRRMQTCAAALLHDVGHGPFSHTLEEILKDYGIEFDHEHLTARLIEENGSEIRGVLEKVDASLPETIVKFIDKKRRTKGEDRWEYRIVSSQLDADRLDYVYRDARSAGLLGPTFDLPRLLDLLRHVDKRMVVDRRAMEVVEAYLLTLDHMYRIVYYHKTVRAAGALLSSVLRRAFELFKNGDAMIFPVDSHGRENPLKSLVSAGEKVALDQYVRIGEFHVWSLMEDWSAHPDPVLKDLAARLMRRHLFKSVNVDSTAPNAIKKTLELMDLARAATRKAFSFLDEKTVNYYVTIDEPSRTSYRLYDWTSEHADESIWIGDDHTKPVPIENNTTKVVEGLKATRYFPRIFFPAEIRDKMRAEVKS